MLLLAAYPDRLSRLSQIITVFLLLVAVLFLTALTTRWVAGYEKGRLKGTNIELLEAQSLTNGKYVQILRVGGKYLAVAVCKDTVTLLCELNPEEIVPTDSGTGRNIGFSSLFQKMLKERGESKEQQDSAQGGHARGGHGSVHAGNLETEKKAE